MTVKDREETIQRIADKIMTLIYDTHKRESRIKKEKEDD